MSVTPLINWILRAFQFLFGVVILGLSVTLIRGHHWGSLPSSVGYGAFLGGISIVAALIGFAATWVTFLEGIVAAIIDAVVAILNIAGGIVRPPLSEPYNERRVLVANILNSSSPSNSKA